MAANSSAADALKNPAQGFNWNLTLMAHSSGKQDERPADLAKVVEAALAA